jgi:RNA polymerase sigma factor (sigma-70 family)
VLRHLPLVRYVASRLCPPASAIEVDDLISAGTIGLIEAADRYDPKRGVPFGSFAYSRIKGAVIDELSRLGVQGAGRSATPDATLSLEAPFHHRPDATLMDVTVDPSVPEPQSSAELSELLAAIRDLPDRYREMLGLSLAGHSGTDIADLYGCSQTLVSQILVDARFQLELVTKA